MTLKIIYLVRLECYLLSVKLDFMQTIILVSNLLNICICPQ